MAHRLKMTGIGVLFAGVLLGGVQGRAVADAKECSAKWREALRSQRDVVKQYELLQKAIATCPDDASYHRSLAYACERLRKYDEALRHYRETLRLAPKEADAWFGQGDVLMALGQIAPAIEAYEAGLELKPKNQRIQHRLELARIKARAEQGSHVTAPEIAKVLQEKALKESGAALSAAGPALRLRISFLSASARLTPDGIKKLEGIAEAIKKAGLTRNRFEIVGHTDNVGPDAYNLNLSRLRAEAVKEHLVAQHGLNGDLLSVAFYGSGRPLVPNDSKANRARNRRVELRKLD